MNLEDKYNKLKDILGNYKKLLVSYSGGVDSTFLLKAAVDKLGTERVSACISQGPSLPQNQYDRAVSLAKDMNVELITIQTDEMDDEQYLKNKADRCYHCKSHLFEHLKKIAEEKNFDTIACGHNLDDTKDYRPGNTAAKDFGIFSPLIEAELTKKDIRDLSKTLNLPTADMPASPCLSSRIAYGLKISQENLKQVEDAEDYLRSLGFDEFRVRHHGETARIEVHVQDMPKLTGEQTRQKIVEKLKEIGFKFVAMDLAGFRSGSLNETLTSEQKKQYKPD
ncbi:MAG: ATP-dependent sacrificial sulfur transferase LarE [Phycisphaerae bacterium]